MAAKRRTSKEPELAPESPFAPIVEALRSLVRGLTASVDPADTSTIPVFIHGKVEGLESAILLCQRAGAGEDLGPDSQPRPKAERTSGASLEARVRALEEKVLGGAVAVPVRPRLVSSLLEPPVSPKKNSSPTPGATDGVERYALGLLRVLAQRHGVGTSASQLAVLAQRSIKSSDFGKAIRWLRDAACVDGSTNDLWITEAGIEIAGPTLLSPRGEELLNLWASKLSKYEAALLRRIYRSGPAGYTVGELAEATGYSKKSSDFGKALRQLRSLDLITDGWPVRVAAIFGDRE